ncbi:hypothetical protein MFIFM68171_06547 [Madurella fahalii]|uniref:Sulfotransferase n=1 Tax=Madurella fahalii TaxID=1157608 RepID=A0ABQ0GF00_9PEZI
MPPPAQSDIGPQRIQLGPDPRTRERSIPMEVLSLGMSRTGTISMQLALETLGYGPVAHGRCIQLNLLELEMASEGLQAKFRPDLCRCKPFGRGEFDQLIGGYRAVTDGRFCHFGPELMAAYPDAKVILVERDIDEWFESFRNTVANTPFRRSLRNRLENFLLPDVRRQRRAYDAMFGAVFNARSTEEVLTHARDVYRRHYREIRKAATPGQLLEYKLGSGWDPLCIFLGKPVPSVPFPRENNSATFRRNLARYCLLLAVRVLQSMALRFGKVAVAAAAIWYYFSLLLGLARHAAR